MSRGTIDLSILTNIANAIRGKLGVSTQYTPGQMASAIGQIKNVFVGQQKTATRNGTVTPDAGYDGLSRVTVNVPNTYTAADENKVVVGGSLVGQTSKNINSNGTYNTPTNSTVNVNVPNSYTNADEGKVVSGGQLASQSTRNVSSNGTYNTTNNNQTVVNVPNSYSNADNGKVVSNGSLVSQTPRSAAITANGTYQTQNNNSVTVNVPQTGSTPTLVSKAITQNGAYSANDDNADGYTGVTVNVPNTYSAGDEGKVVSSGVLTAQTTKSITTNGTHTTTTNNEVVVNVPNSYGAADEGKVVDDGALVIQTSRTITENGTVDTTTNDEVVVNVQPSYSAGDEGKVVDGGELVEQTSTTKTANGTYDTTTNNEVVVNVQPTLQSKTVTQNGTVTPDSGYDGLSSVVVNVADGNIVYGFHVDGSESDPSLAVTYLEGALGMTPAAMDYTNGVFDYGSWEDAFFMPSPCMLKYDGTVDYYLDPDDYSKKADGVTASDVDDFSYGGNAMMEWGRNGRKIWYKIVPDSGDPTSASVYIANYQVDSNYHAWSFVNNQGNLVDHFYTPIYNGTLDDGGRLRSISGKTESDFCESKTAAQEVYAAELNNPGGSELWYTEVYSDITLINLLLILVGKSLNTQAVYGVGNEYHYSGGSYVVMDTGTMDNRGLFWGDDTNEYGVKVFGMEHWWGNIERRYAGHMLVDNVHKYKMTRGRGDGSTADDYVQSAQAADYSGYITGASCPQALNAGLITEMEFDGNCFQVKTYSGDYQPNYWCDVAYVASGVNYARRGGDNGFLQNYVGAFFEYLASGSGSVSTGINAALSCKPAGGGSTPTLITKSITENGTYDASDDDADGYSSVTVNVSGGGGDILTGSDAPAASLGSDGDVYLRVIPLSNNVNYVEYLDSSGTQYINTGIVADHLTDIVAGVGWKANSYGIGTRTGGATSQTYALYIGGGASRGISITKNGDSSYSFDGNKVTAPSDSGKIVCKTTSWKNGNDYMIASYYDGHGTTLRLTRQSAFSTTYPQILFGANQAGTINAGIIRIYRVTYYQAGSPIHDYLPCLDGNGVACMWDNIAGEYVYNDGTGDFTYGSTITPDPLDPVYYVKKSGAWEVIQ